MINNPYNLHLLSPANLDVPHGEDRMRMTHTINHYYFALLCTNRHNSDLSLKFQRK